MLTRRKFFTLLAAPAIVHAGNLMPVRALEPEFSVYDRYMSYEKHGKWIWYSEGQPVQFGGETYTITKADEGNIIELRLS